MANDGKDEKNAIAGQPVPASWVKPQLRYVGKIGELLEGGGGKLSVSGGDTGESRKERGGSR